LEGYIVDATCTIQHSLFLVITSLEHILLISWWSVLLVEKIGRKPPNCSKTMSVT